MSKINNVGEIVEFIKTNGISNEDWNKMYNAAVDFEKQKTEQDKHEELLNNIRKLENLYATDKYFRLWCKHILDIVKYQEYIDDLERNSPFAVKEEYADTYHENYYIPVMCPAISYSNGNPVVFITTSCIEVYVHLDLIDLITDEDTGTKAFAVFWKEKFQTKILPEFIKNSDHLERVCSVQLSKKSTSNDYKIANMYFDYTLWDYKELEDLYKEALK